MHYAFTENFILPYSHDEVVHGKKSLLNKMYGNYDEKFASLRALLGFMYAHPGKKLLFMGSEFGQFIEWDDKKQLDWFLLKHEKHSQMQQYVKALNAFYTGCPALYQIEDGWGGFTWLNVDEAKFSSLSFLRRGNNQGKSCVCAFNFTPVSVEGFVIGLPGNGTLQEKFSSDDVLFGGGGHHNTATITASHEGFAVQPYRAVIDLPPLAAVYFDYNEKGLVL